MNGSFKVLLILCVFLLVGCGKEIPSDIIQPDKMEKVLYDYQLVSAMNDQIPYTDNYKKEILRKYVFNKHRITES